MLGSCDVISHFSLILQVVKFLSSKVQLKASTRKTKTQDFFSWLFFIDTHKVFALLRLSLKNVEFNCLEKQFVLSNGSIVPQLSGSSINLFFCRFCQIKFAVELVFFGLRGRLPYDQSFCPTVRGLILSVLSTSITIYYCANCCDYTLLGFV